MRNASLWRRLTAIVYDSLLVTALLIALTLVFISLRGGEAVELGDTAYRIALLLSAWLYFAGFWTVSGRTPGMLCWRVQLETRDGRRPPIGMATIRFLAALLSWAPLGLGFWWQLWDRDGLAWHDRLSGTRLVHYPKSEP